MKKNFFIFLNFAQVFFCFFYFLNSKFFFIFLKFFAQVKVFFGQAFFCTKKRLKRFHAIHLFNSSIFKNKSHDSFDTITVKVQEVGDCRL